MRSEEITRSIIDFTVEKGLRDIEQGSRRSVRRMVDLGEHFARGAFQKELFQTAQRHLDHKDSSYYTLAQNVIRSVDHKTLKTFGINLGYNSLTLGTRLIRQKISEEGHHIPWTIAVDLKEFSPSGVTENALQSLILQGMELGVFSYFIRCSGEAAPLESLLELLKKNDQCAFLLFLTPELLDRNRAAAISECHNTLVSLECRDLPAYREGALLLKELRCLFAAHLYYSEEELPSLHPEKWLDALPPTGCAVTFLLARPHCGKEARAQVRSYVREVRNAARAQPLYVVDFYSDLTLVDQTVSGASCLLCVSPEGYARRLGQETVPAPELHIARQDLATILSLLMPAAEKNAGE
ncbi:MAG: hypothetical protein Q4C22_04280 [Bacillota bacterium]|nr:hypothetical protein [Bacillota bacterium]